MTDLKPIPKSLHTITVLVQVIRALRDGGYLLDDAIDEALSILNLVNRPDPYGLVEAARNYFRIGGVKGQEATREGQAND